MPDMFGCPKDDSSTIHSFYWPPVRMSIGSAFRVRLSMRFSPVIQKTPRNSRSKFNGGSRSEFVWRWGGAGGGPGGGFLGGGARGAKTLWSRGLGGGGSGGGGGLAGYSGA